jgi:hypothetical protein
MAVVAAEFSEKGPTSHKVKRKTTPPVPTGVGTGD